MSSDTREVSVVRLTQKGQATIPKRLREKFGIEAPGEVFVYEEGDRIVLEPVPTLEQLQGIHAGDHDPGRVLERVREMESADRRREEREAERLVERHADSEP
jgi:AbrB family looped-hinge helix DNA binding protein